MNRPLFVLAKHCADRLGAIPTDGILLVVDSDGTIKTCLSRGVTWDMFRRSPRNVRRSR